MILMKTRSSRFFVVLLHLMGVSTRLPNNQGFGFFWSESGIVGVNPFSIVLESSEPQHVLMQQQQQQQRRRSSSSIGEQQQQQQQEPQQLLLQQQPYWLQDTVDQTCLDPMGGFSECGDATLWFIIPKPKRHARLRQWIRWATEDEDEEEPHPLDQGYALQLVDDISVLHQHQHQNNRPLASIASKKQKQQDISGKECLTRRKNSNELKLVTCSQDRAYTWQFNEHGILHFDKKAASHNNSEKKKKLLRPPSLKCVGRNASQTVLMTCDGQPHNFRHKEKTSTVTNKAEERVVQIALVRQATLDYSSLTSSSGSSSTIAPSGSPSSNTEVKEQPVAERPSSSLPSNRDIAHSHASPDQPHVEHLKSPRMTATTLSPHHPSKQQQQSQQQQWRQERAPLESLLHDTNPILLMANSRGMAGERSRSKRSSSSPSSKAQGSSSHHETSSAGGGNAGASSGGGAGSGAPGAPGAAAGTTRKPMIRKIEMNPYIAASEKEKWTDPQTGLIYDTDLSPYLGHDRKEVGRHTLTGVGQFTKTMLKIKVYGVGMYVSKRDILADPVMEEYAALTSEELRARPDFFQVLRKMVSSAASGEKAGTFDRTIFLKTNMQLSTATMRSSLDADWKLLTQADKDLLIGSSMKARPTSDIMLDFIQSEGNPSRCSCGQIAPEEYQADPECCGRGTELVFTWRKNGDLEVRLNGDLLDTFPRPDIAEAIFYEYLRLDDPMSTDFLDRVVDGFPMLLGPLAQVKGVSSPAMQHSAPPKIQPNGSNPVFKVLEGFGDTLSSHANTVAGFVHNSAAELTSGAFHTARAVGDAARTLGGEVERRRDLIGKHVSQFAQQTVGSIYGGKDQKALTVSLPDFWLGDMGSFGDEDIPGPEHERNPNAPRGGFVGAVFAKLFGNSEPVPSAPDEIVPMIHPSADLSTQRIFLGMVHFYLLLMLIVTFPAQLTTRTKLVIIRKSVQGAISDSEYSDSDGSAEDTTPRKSSPMDKSHGAAAHTASSRFRLRRSKEDEGKIQKRLNYVL